MKLPWPNNTLVDQLTPSHVTVKRCSGGCYTHQKDCVPANIQKRLGTIFIYLLLKSFRTISVMMGRCPIGGGKCEKECADVEVSFVQDKYHLRQLPSPVFQIKVEDHTTCSCGCQQQEESCSKDQIFNLDACSCRCR